MLAFSTVSGENDTDADALGAMLIFKSCTTRPSISSAIGTSLGVAPALLVAQQAEFVDLDGPLLLASDRVPGLRYEGSTIHPSGPEFWG